MDVQKREAILKELREFFLEAILKLKFAFSKIWDFLMPFIKAFLSDIGVLLARTAMEVVTEIQKDMPVANGDDKRREAFKRIEEKLKGQGIQIGASLINAAIEAAVQKIKDYK